MDERPGTDGEVAPVTLDDAERRRVLRAAAIPVVLVGAVLLVLLLADRATVLDLVIGTGLYGGLLGLTVAVVAHERALAAHCPRCGAVAARGAEACTGCDYDLARRPVYLCEERHERAYAPGVCGCGRRLRMREPAPGLGRSVRRTLWAGAWLFALLVGTWVLIGLTG